MVSRRRTIVTAAILCGIIATLAQPSQAQNSAKLGNSYDIVYNTSPQTSINNMGTSSWYYNWAVSNTMNLHGKQFVPMLHDPIDVTSQNLATAKTYGNTLLTFNEPDQVGVTVDQALNAWPQIQASGMRVGAPSATNDNWLSQFISGASTRGYRVDFINLHTYPDVGPSHNAIAAADAMIAQVQAAYNKYGKPIWITEFALAPWGTPPTAADQLAFMKNILPRLEALPYVERYCWWTLSFQNYADNLCDGNGNVLPLGAYYKNFIPSGGGGGVIANGVYNMTPASSTGMRLDAFGGGTTNGSQAGIWNANGSYNQRWLFKNVGGNNYEISPEYAPSLCLDVSGFGGSGALIDLWGYGGQANQKWIVAPFNGGYTFTPTHATGTRLDSFGTAAGTRTGIWTANGSTNQTWWLF